MPSIHRTPTSAGIGLRLPHIEEAVATRPSVGWLEVHPENFVANPHAVELLCDLARVYPISVHTVGLSVGSATGIDRQHLAKIRAMIDRVEPVLVSGHLAWSTHGAEYLNDLLPLPFDAEALRIVSEQLAEVQDGLGRPFLLENPSSYVGFAGSTMTEVQFLSASPHRRDPAGETLRHSPSSLRRELDGRGRWPLPGHRMADRSQAAELTLLLFRDEYKVPFFDPALMARMATFKWRRSAVARPPDRAPPRPERE